MPGQRRGRARARLEVELGDARVVRESLVDPRALEPAREHGVLGCVDDPLPGRSSAEEQHAEHRSRQREPVSPWDEHCCGDERHDEEGEHDAARAQRRAGDLVRDPPPERSRHGVDPGLGGEVPEREEGGQDEREHDSCRRRDERPGKPVGEPAHEEDQPEREEVERVAVMEPVVAPGRAGERGDDEEPDRVRGQEQRCIGGGALVAGPAAEAEEAREDDRSDRQREHGEVDLEVGEVVHEPLRDLERLVAAPELPVRAERVRRRVSGEQAAHEDNGDECEWECARPEADEVVPAARPSRGHDDPDRREGGEPGHVERAELGAREECGGDRGEHEELARDRRSLEGEHDRVERPRRSEEREALGHHRRDGDRGRDRDRERRGEHRPPRVDEPPRQQVDRNRREREEERVRCLEEVVACVRVARDEQKRREDERIERPEAVLPAAQAQPLALDERGRGDQVAHLVGVDARDVDGDREDRVGDEGDGDHCREGQSRPPSRPRPHSARWYPRVATPLRGRSSVARWSAGRGRSGWARSVGQGAVGRLGGAAGGLGCSWSALSAAGALGCCRSATRPCPTRDAFLDSVTSGTRECPWGRSGRRPVAKRGALSGRSLSSALRCPRSAR